MNIKTITNGNKELFDEIVNKTNKELKAKFTQTSVSVINGSTLLYTAILFYD